MKKIFLGLVFFLAMGLAVNAQSEKSARKTTKNKDPKIAEGTDEAKARAQKKAIFENKKKSAIIAEKGKES